MEQAAKIKINKDGTLSVPDHVIIPFIEGDGTGPDIWRATRTVIDSAVQTAYQGRKKIAWAELLVGEKGYQQCGERLSKDAWIKSANMPWPSRGR